VLLLTFFQKFLVASYLMGSMLRAIGRLEASHKRYHHNAPNDDDSDDENDHSLEANSY